MKALLLLCVLTTTESSSLWSRFRNSDMDFLVAHDEGSVHVKAYVKGPATVNLDDPAENIKFHLFTRTQTQGIQLQIISEGVLLNYGFDFNCDTKLLIHGFANSASSDFIKLLKNAYMKGQEYSNVVVVDWSALCKPPFYTSAVENVQTVGACTAKLLKWLVAQGASLSRLHMLGHSIGAHIAGIAGHHLGHLGRVGRITGLDPAKPMFELETKDRRLSSDDADFVDCIHTCGGFLGLLEPICSVDFYPNGGTNPQPGCTFDFFGTCSHQRAYKYFAESVTLETAFRAVRCSAMESYSPVNCSSGNVATMGEHTNSNSRGIFYLDTAAAPPFSLVKSVDPVNTFTKFLWYFC